jgi:hypothetical protein
MTDAETIAELRRQLAERDGEIRRLRALLVVSQRRRERLFKQALADAWSSSLPDGSRLTITFAARPE